MDRLLDTLERWGVTPIEVRDFLLGLVTTGIIVGLLVWATSEQTRANALEVEVHRLISLTEFSAERWHGCLSDLEPRAGAIEDVLTSALGVAD